MKLTTLLIIVTLMQVSAAGFSQSSKLSFDFKDKSLEEIFSYIEKNTDYSIFYKNELIENSALKSGNYSDKEVFDILDDVFKGENLSYEIRGKIILVVSNGEGTSVSSQKLIKVTGKVTDSSGQPLPGVTVVIKGTTNGTITDFDGVYSIPDVPSNAIIQFSFVGMRTEEISVAGNTSINVVMVEDAIGIEEVVAVGYGSIRKSDLTGSVSRVTVSESEERANTSIENMLQGQVAGVQITSNTGAPGGGMSFSIRGASSISGSNQPLIVIDGYPIDSDNSGARVSGGSQSGYLDALPDDNVLANLNPGDIESVEILKDASATAIYGSRAANGVVLITTKRGQAGNDKITYSYRTDISRLPKLIKVLNTADYLEYSNEAYLNDGLDSLYSENAIAEYSKTNTNWQDLIYRTAYSQNHQLSLSGGQKKLKYAVSLGYLGQEGVVKNSRFDRGTVRINLEREFNKKFKMGINMSGTMSKNKAAMQSSNRADPSTSVVYGALRSRPFESPYTADDELDITQKGNPLTLITLAEDVNNVTSIFAKMYMQYNIFKGLNFKVTGGVNNYASRRDFYHPRGTTLGDLEGGYAYLGSGNSFNYLTEYTLNFNRTFNKKHRISAVAGYTWQEWTRKNFAINVLNFPNDNMLYYDLSSGTSISNPRTNTTIWALSSFIGRANYSFDNRFLFTFTGRADGSTRLAEGSKWDFFPSLALGWNMHNEKFLKPIDVISQLKLRASYGLSGNQSIGVGATKSRLNTTSSVVNQSIQIAYTPANMANGTLHWETTKQTNIGMDLGLFNSRLTFSFEYYNKLTEDLLIGLTIPPVNGFTTYSTNQGSIRNRGLEFDLRGNILNKKFKWDMTGNISFNRNKIVNLGEGIESFTGPSITAVGGQSLNIAQVGQPIGAFYGYRILGIFQNQDEIDNSPADPDNNTPGSFKYKDISGPDGEPDGVISAYDREIIGNPYPDYIFGLTNNFQWKNLSLNIFIQGSIGQDIINANRFYLDGLARGISTNIRQEAWDNRWTGEGTSNIFPQASSSATPFNNRFADFIVEDASYIRLKNITLSYNLKKIKFAESLKIFVTAGNLLTITNYKGYDPEINSRGDNSMTPGIDSGSIPQYQSYSIGVNLGF